jgi:hypothetical protein
MATPGRPKITPDKFGEGWQDRVLELFAEGASKLEVYTGVLDIDYETFVRLCNEDPIFSRTIKKGEQLSQMWWESNGRKNLTNKDYSYTGWYMNMKNRFGWKDRQDVTTNDKDLPAPILPVGE